jgi:hypothetical protein
MTHRFRKKTKDRFDSNPHHGPTESARQSRVFFGGMEKIEFDLGRSGRNLLPCPALMLDGHPSKGSLA